MTLPNGEMKGILDEFPCLEDSLFVSISQITTFLVLALHKFTFLLNSHVVELSGICTERLCVCPYTTDTVYRFYTTWPFVYQCCFLT